MNKNYKRIKNTVIIVSILFIILLLIFTVDVINEEPKWSWFNINFNSPKVANYGTLISGLLSFLAILFVIFGIAEQKEQSQKEKVDKIEEINNDFKNRLQLLKSLLIKITDEIKTQGERMETFYKLELEHPTQANTTHFSANKSFNRILEMDYLMNYQCIQHFFKEEIDWEKMFLNLNSYVDFYSESLIEHRHKYQSHIKDKVKRHQEISNLCANFLDESVKLVNRYRTDFGVNEYLKQKWAITFNDFIPAYYSYINSCKEKQLPSNFRTISDDFFLEFLQRAMTLRDEVGFDNYNSEELVALASKIRKKIYEIEMYSIPYAENIKYYFEEYFDTNCEPFKKFTSITDKLNYKLQTIN